MTTTLQYVITTTVGNGTHGSTGDGGAAAWALLHAPIGLTLDDSGNLYIADYANHKIRKISAGNITTFAGTGTAGSSGDGYAATSAKLYRPRALAYTSGMFFILDYSNVKVRLVDSSGIISTYAGVGALGTTGDDGPATSAKFQLMMDITVDGQGSKLLSFPFHTIYQQVTHPFIHTYIHTIANSRIFGRPFLLPGNLYIADYNMNRIRVVDWSSGIISNFAGSSANTHGSTGDNGLATSALFYQPSGITNDLSGVFYISDSGNNKIRKVDSAGIVSTFAGTGTAGNSGDGYAATSAKLYRPVGIALDSSGNLIIADAGNHVVRIIAYDTGIITTCAGGGTSGFVGDGGLAKSAYLNTPYGVTADVSGNIYVSDYGDNRVRNVTGMYNYPTGRPSSQPTSVPSKFVWQPKVEGVRLYSRLLLLISASPFYDIDL